MPRILPLIVTLMCLIPTLTHATTLYSEDEEQTAISVLASFPEDGQELGALNHNEEFTFKLSDNSEVSFITCTITSIIESNNAEEQFGSFRTSEINENGEFYWKNTGDIIYFMTGRLYRFDYFVYNLENKICCSGTITIKGITDPDSLIDFNFNPINTEISYIGNPSDVESVVVMFTFEEDAYCDFNKFLKLELTDSKGEPVEAQFFSKSNLKEPTKYGINIVGKDWSYDESYTLHVPTMFGDGEWFGLNGANKYMTGKANSPMEIVINLSKEDLSFISSIDSTNNETAIYYDLSGRNCGMNPTVLSPGIYITNGRKVRIR